jgi:hypothetical protein
MDMDRIISCDHSQDRNDMIKFILLFYDLI